MMDLTKWLDSLTSTRQCRVPLHDCLSSKHPFGSIVYHSTSVTPNLLWLECVVTEQGIGQKKKGSQTRSQARMSPAMGDCCKNVPGGCDATRAHLSDVQDVPGVGLNVHIKAILFYPTYD
ncbi:hypothetical protein J6590_052553 [Homalodisca vitripennis]|nr:hypothetical protein J6590_052553 [Homalodisca vitripennis]